jgi:hypothetical protein
MAKDDSESTPLDHNEVLCEVRLYGRAYRGVLESMRATLNAQTEALAVVLDELRARR